MLMKRRFWQVDRNLDLKLDLFHRCAIKYLESGKILLYEITKKEKIGHIDKLLLLKIENPFDNVIKEKGT